MIICQLACLVNIAPDRLLISPAHHSTRKNILNPDVDLIWKFLYNCGNCANSHDIIERVPKRTEINANGVGIQVFVNEDIQANAGDTGVQCGGSWYAARL